MFVIIIGGGKVGSHLASLLLEEGHTVRVIDMREDVLLKLHRSLPAEVIHSGDGTDPARLEQTGVSHADVLAAVTGSDETNLVAASLARFEFHVPRIVARVNDPRNQWLFTPDMGVDVAINQADMMAKLIVEEMSLSDMFTLLKLRRGDVELVEEKIHVTAPVVGKAICEIAWPPHCTVAAILRKSEVIAPHGATVLEANDELLVVVRATERAALAQLLARA
ncbi:MAG TPA: TrkA family potassium uptake protein [Chloroflexi bacterium]|nr:TrkA family potassium uptake protein [Chloroflexota bacterium]